MLIVDISRLFQNVYNYFSDSSVCLYVNHACSLYCNG